MKTPNAPGHTTVLTVLTHDRGATLALECACGAVFARRRCQADDWRSRADVRNEGQAAMERHAQEIWAGLKVLTERRAEAEGVGMEGGS